MPSIINANDDKFGEWKYSASIRPICERFSDKEKQSVTGRDICHIIGEDVHQIAGQVFRIWHFYLSLILYCKHRLSKYLYHLYEKSFVERWGACIFRETLTVRARLRVVSTSLSEHEMISRKVRNQSTMNQLEAPPLQDLIYMIDPKEQAVIFEQTYNLPDNRSAESIRLLDQIEKEKNSQNKKASEYIKQKMQKSKLHIVVHRKNKTETTTDERKPPLIVRSVPPTQPKNDCDEIKLDFIEQNAKPKKKKKRKKKRMHFTKETDHDCIGKHLFVLVHGYQGNSWDMRMFRNRLLVKCPDDVFLMSECNEKESLTEGDIAEMGS